MGVLTALVAGDYVVGNLLEPGKLRAAEMIANFILTLMILPCIYLVALCVRLELISPRKSVRKCKSSPYRVMRRFASQLTLFVGAKVAAANESVFLVTEIHDTELHRIIRSLPPL